MAKDDEERGSQDVNFELRRALNDGYAFVLGRQATQTFGAYTYEELADAQIDRIEGKGTDLRPNELERVDRMERDILDLVEQVRSIPPERFVLRDPERDVNTDAALEET